MSDKVRRLLNELVPQPKRYIEGVVKSVSLDDLTCEVEPADGGAELVDVRLRSVIDGGQDGFLMIPVVGSDVTVAMLDEDTCFVTQYGAIQLYSIRTERESLKAVLDDLLDAIGRMVFATNQGPTVELVNAPEFVAIKQRLNALFKD
ncbi:hypothetical protein [Hymenobacter sp. B81]|uniref:hypothetical protein n=1 Tax=Hymenobacter sp. B81 TaxID=3344878 RepID=UPI0037DD5586